MEKKIKPLRLGDLLVQVGALTEEQLQYALEMQKEKRMKLGEVLQELNFITSKEIAEVLEYQLGIPHVDLDKYYIDHEMIALISEEFARNNSVMPMKLENGVLHIAMDDPLNIVLINDLEIITGYIIEPRIASNEDIHAAIDQYYSKKTAEKAVEDFTKEFAIDEQEIDQNLLREINKAPVVRLVNTIILQAAQSKASDIHIEAEEENLRIRFRIDGDLQEIMKPAKQTHGAIVTRIKIMANMNIAERRLPQDGRIETEVNGKKYDLRVSTIPSIYGEKVVIRMVDRTSFLIDKQELGLSKQDMILFNEIAKNTNGIILITGPTGSGKSTTMYAMLNELNDSRKNIITIEDPVEYRMKGIIQSQVNHKAGYDFANGLKSMLRQDPDIIMVGEIRDVETALIASRAAITGHLVLSTLHTNNAVSTVNRLIDMGIQSYLVASTLVAILAQTLVKKVCPHCGVPYMPNEEERRLLNLNGEDVEIFKGVGCTHCNQTGYTGRTAVFEIVKFDSHARELVNNGKSTDELRRYFTSNGSRSLIDNCRQLVLAGVTTTDELSRISYSVEG
ncbi:MAG: Flp pilus assembly complex ATPase component TadA [Clostridia bacterium]|nr:Flp pilus assembly complex ATPase component TadA [Clostridia bacterium]